jgi:DNA-binding Lrp family transcriptional regulator
MPQTAYILITTKYGKERQVCQELSNNKEVEDTDILYGNFDIITKVVTEDMKHLDNFILTKIRANPNIESTNTLIVVEPCSK